MYYALKQSRRYTCRSKTIYLGVETEGYINIVLFKYIIYFKKVYY